MRTRSLDRRPHWSFRCAPCSRCRCGLSSMRGGRPPAEPCALGRHHGGSRSGTRRPLLERRGDQELDVPELEGLGDVGQRAVLRGVDKVGQVSAPTHRSEEHTSELQSLTNLVCRLLLEKKKKKNKKGNANKQNKT